MNFNLLFSFILLCCVSNSYCKQIPSASSISCFLCNSRDYSDKSCHDPFHPANSTYKEHCKMSKENHIGEFPAHFCVKIMGKNVLTKKELVVRTCTIENMDNQCGLFKFDNETLKGCIMTCNKDGCNRSHMKKTEKLSILVFVIYNFFLILNKKLI